MGQFKVKIGQLVIKIMFFHYSLSNSSVELTKVMIFWKIWETLTKSPKFHVLKINAWNSHFKFNLAEEKIYGSNATSATRNLHSWLQRSTKQTWFMRDVTTESTAVVNNFWRHILQHLYEPNTITILYIKQIKKYNYASYKAQNQLVWFFHIWYLSLVLKFSFKKLL